MSLSFTRHIHRTDAEAVIRQNLFDTIQFCLDTRELLFQELKSFSSFGTSHFNVLAQISSCNRIQDRGSPIRITMVITRFNNTSLLSFFANIKSFLQCSDRPKFATLRKSKHLSRQGKHLRHANIKRITTISAPSQFPDFRSQQDLLVGRNNFK